MIAFLGLGRMGTPMAGRLLAAGHPLVVWNRTPERTEPLVAKGAKAAPTPAEAVRGGEIGRGAALKVVLITAIVGGVTLVGEVLAVAHALGLSGEFAQARLAAGPLAGLVKPPRIRAATSRSVSPPRTSGSPSMRTATPVSSKPRAAGCSTPSNREPGPAI